MSSKHVAQKMPSARWAQIKLLPKITATWLWQGGTFVKARDMVQSRRPF
jgi:hypothetical protein